MSRRKDMSRRDHIGEQEVRHWIEHGGPVEMREIRAAMAELWRRGLCTLNRREDGEIVAELTEAGGLSNDENTWVM
jgi:hypothetical protein